METLKQLNYDLAMAFAAARQMRRTAEELQAQAELTKSSIDELEFEMVREDFFNAYEYYRAQSPLDESMFPLK
ncbi:MAG: hypothetical protein FWD84_01805 [Oscillospiraceae bacterium]|nr:hypothetical protein [Oscillospiraceae bacterium]